MKTKFNLFGNTFTHLTGGNKGYSVHGKVSKHIEWVQDGTGIGSFYLDYSIDQAFADNSLIPKFAWLLESKFITTNLVEQIQFNPDKYIDKFDCIFTHDKKLLNIHPKFKWVPAQGFWIKQPKIYPKTKLVSMISSNKSFCEGHKVRLDWINKIRNQVDLYGRGFNEIEFKEDGLCDYMFSVAIENGEYETYFTEKILDCFATGTIPIYIGAPDIGNYFNLDGIIQLDRNFDVSNLTEELYDSKKYAIKDNLERAKKMEVLEDFIWNNYLESVI